MGPLEGIRRLAGWLSQRYDEGLADGSASATSSPATPHVPPEPGLTLGVDLSSNNSGTIDFGRMRDAGVRRVVLRATDGVGWVDPRLAEFYVGADAAGVTVEAYHFLRVRHGRAQDAAAQVVDFFDAAPWASRLILDCERLPPGLPGEEHNAATGDEWRAAILEAIGETWSRHGARPLVYASPSFFAERSELAGCAEIAERADCWVAAYGFAACPPCGPWGTKRAGWQFTGAGRIPGVSGNIDLSWWSA